MRRPWDASRRRGRRQPSTAGWAVFWQGPDARPDDAITGDAAFLDVGLARLRVVTAEDVMRVYRQYVAAFTMGGFAGPLDWYRALDLNWAQTRFLQDQKIRQPALFIVGENDPVRLYAGAHEAGLKDWVPGLTRSVVVPGAGHWIQQERPEAVNALLLEFLTAVGAG